MTDNVLLDFSHVYPDDADLSEKGIKRINLSDIEGTDMFCTRQAAEEIRKRLKDTGPKGIHFLDSGNFHYATLFFTEKIRTPYSLILIDNHTDMQKPVIPDLLSCGSWAGMLLLKDENLRQMIIAGPRHKSMDGIDIDEKNKLVFISMEEIDRGRSQKAEAAINPDFPVYISIDKDVLRPYYARTNWDQGRMSEDILKKLILDIFRHQKVIGIDICGECSLNEPLPRLAEDMRINRKTNEKLYIYLTKLMQYQKGK